MGAVAKVLRHPRRIDNLAGVEQAVGVERRFYFAECLVHRRPEHFFVPLATRQTVAVFAAERAAILQYEVRNVRRDAAHSGHVVRVFEVHKRADVQTTDAGVAVESAIRAVAPQRLAEAGDELGQPLRRHRAILHERHRLPVAAHSVQQRHPRFAQVP